MEQGIRWDAESPVGMTSTFSSPRLVAGLGPKGFDATAWTFATYMGGLV